MVDREDMIFPIESDCAHPGGRGRGATCGHQYAEHNSEQNLRKKSHYSGHAAHHPGGGSTGCQSRISALLSREASKSNRITRLTMEIRATELGSCGGIRVVSVFLHQILCCIIAAYRHADRPFAVEEELPNFPPVTMRRIIQRAPSAGRAFLTSS